jgi:hypothetical protein
MILTSSSIHELSPASTGDTAVVNTKKWAVLWRSILMSSLDSAMYPYCLWVKSLSFGNLESLLEDLARDPYKEIRAWFFSPPMDRLHILAHRTTRAATRRTIMDIGRIIVESANQLTGFIKTAATKEDKRARLTSLEGYNLPTANLPGWVSSFSLLTSLTVRDGSVLTSDVSNAIRESCPHFRELVCHFCTGTDVDEELAGFFNGLAPDTLETFKIMSTNEIGPLTYSALSQHSLSLKTLELALYVQDAALVDLPLLGDCTNLTSLRLDVSFHLDAAWGRLHQEEVRQITSWLKQCSPLKKLSFKNMPEAAPILLGIVSVPGIRLTDLELINPGGNFGGEDSVSAGFSTQQELKTFIFRNGDESWDIKWLSAICECENLRKLDLMTPDFRPDLVLANIAHNLKYLEDLTFDSEHLLAFEHMLYVTEIPRLKVLNVNATTALDFASLKELANLMVHGSGFHQGLEIHINRNRLDYVGVDELSIEEEKQLNQALSVVGGRIEITYDGDINEMHESDFSD